MSELKAHRFLWMDEVWPDANLGTDYYIKSEADKVIAELERRLNEAHTELELWRDGSIISEEHQKELEDVQATAYAESVDAGMRERRLKEAQRWRKCSEEMPEDGAEVLASDGYGIWLCYKTTMCDGSPWFQPDGQPHIEGVTHWMPLPSAPREEK